MELKVALDTVWTVVAGFLVFFMNAGFACVESGFTRSKNAANILSKNFVVFAISIVAFWALGWGLMFGDGNGFMGLEGLMFLSGADASPLADDYTGVYGSISWATIPLLAKFFFQLVFAATAATIVSGAVAERIKYVSFIIFSFILVAVLYPITGHWIWGGGWLGSMGMWDFAGSTVVHSVGGWAALAGALVLGPRFGKYVDGKIKPIQGHNLALATLGVMILWLGWFGFNPGSTMGAAPDDIAKICVTTAMGASGGIIAATIISWIFLGKPDLGMTLNGCLAGLVAITAPCAFVSVGASLIIGLVAGVIVVCSIMAFDRAKIDDPVGAISVHLVCGIFGTLAVGLFAQEGVGGIDASGLFYGGGAALLIKQFIGVAAVGAFIFISSLIVWGVLKATIGIRVSIAEEVEGLDIGEHGNVAYPEFVSRRPGSSFVFTK